MLESFIGNSEDTHDPFRQIIDQLKLVKARD